MNNNFIAKSKYYYLSATKKSVEDQDETIKVFLSLKECEENNNAILTSSSKTLDIKDEEYDAIKNKLNSYTYTISSQYRIISIKE